MSWRVQWILVSALVVPVALLGCCRQRDTSGVAGGDDSGWLVILKSCPGPRQAAEDSKKLASKVPEGLQVGAAKLARDEEKYVVAAGAWGSRHEAESTAEELASGLGVKLRVVRASELQPLEPAETTGPAGEERLLGLARWLPLGEGFELVGFELLPGIGERCNLSATLVPGGWDSLRRTLCRMGLRSIARAAYLPHKNRWGQLVQVTVALGAGVEDAVDRLKKELLSSVGGRRGRARMEVGVEKRLLSWGTAETTVLKPRMKARRRKSPPGRQLWIAPLPEGQGVLVVIAKEPEVAAGLLKPEGFGLPWGITLSGEFMALLETLPVVDEGREISELAVGPFSKAWALLPRRKAWYRNVRTRPAVRYRVSQDDFWWRVNKVRLGDEAAAERVFAEGFVEGQRRTFEWLMKRKRKVRYRLSLRLVDTAAGKAWYLQGHRGGRLQLLYLRQGTEIVWVEAPMLRDAVEAESRFFKGLSVLGI